MDFQTLKQKITSGQLSDEELRALIENNSKHPRARNGFVKNIFKGYTEAVSVPNMWKTTLEAFLILVIISGALVLSYAGKMDAVMTAVLLASVLGFLFGKMR